ncbi:UNVERIFIED_CONTAM: vesicle transport protein [Sesamum latifolium]|uniref:Vesicle transport protein n=1 Tax=Sesamum latifolium TaxID=2727402 RepID=A0AAW2YEI1_9LAMI
MYGNQIETAGRPYAFIKFDTFMQKTKKLYQDTRTQRNIAKLNDELYEVHQIMTRNVQEVLGVGEKLDQVSQMSSRLTSESRIYADKAKDLNRQALIRKWAPVAIVLGVVFLLLWVVPVHFIDMARSCLNWIAVESAARSEFHKCFIFLILEHLGGFRALMASDQLCVCCYLVCKQTIRAGFNYCCSF